MLKSRHKTLNPRTIIITGIIALVVIVIISLIGIALRGNGEINIVNQPSANNSIISEGDLSRVKKEVYSILKNYNNTPNNFIDVYVRWDTVEQDAKTGRITFLIDVDDYQQSYIVNLDQYNVTLGCPNPEDSKYHDSFCIGNDGEYNDSISVLFGSDLPLTDKTSKGETFEIVRVDPTNGEWNRDLAVWIFACPANDNLTARVAEAVDEIITSRGGSPAAFTKHFYNMPCDGE